MYIDRASGRSFHKPWSERLNGVSPRGLQVGAESFESGCPTPPWFRYFPLSGLRFMSAVSKSNYSHTRHHIFLLGRPRSQISIMPGWTGALRHVSDASHDV